MLSVLKEEQIKALEWGPSGGKKSPFGRAAEGSRQSHEKRECPKRVSGEG